MTIGYGAPTNDIFYGGCSSIATLLTLEASLTHLCSFLDFTDSTDTCGELQSFAGIILDSICIGIFYARFARANVRSLLR